MKIKKIQLGYIEEISTPLVGCVGFFDGLHLGHQALINKTIELAKKYNTESALITFSPDPWITLKGLDHVQHLTTEKRREELAEKFGIDQILIIEFNQEVANLTSEKFIEEILKPCHLKALVCGFDFHYGIKGSGNTKTLAKEAENSFEVHVVESVDIDNEKISSTRISKNLEEGKIEEVNKLLGYTYQLEGIVTHGQKRGREIGFPTANLKISNECMIPKKGVYAGFVLYQNKRYRAMINVGHNPTFNYSFDLSIEANIFDFNEQIYDQTLKIEFISYLRSEMKFNSIDDLIQQMNQDKIKTNEVLKTYE